MLCKEGLCEVHKVTNNMVVSVSPKRSKFKAVACFFFLLDLSTRAVFDMVKSCRVGIILGVRSVRDNEDLNVFIKSTRRPKTISLITVNLIERFTNSNTTTFKFYVNKRKTVYSIRKSLYSFRYFQNRNRGLGR